MNPRRLAVVACAGALLLAACSDDPSEEAFCEAAERTVAAGPLFPDRTDGEPVAAPAALTALEDLATASPDEISSEVDVLVVEARALVAEAEARIDASSTTTGPATTAEGTQTRPERADVDAAQAAVVTYVSETCAVDLTA